MANSLANLAVGLQIDFRSDVLYRTVPVTRRNAVHWGNQGYSRQSIPLPRHILCAAKKSKTEPAPKAPTTPNRLTSFFQQKKSKDVVESLEEEEEEEEFEQAFRVFDLKQYAQPFPAPWSGKAATLGMIGWIASFVGVGVAILPLASYFAGPDGLAGMSQQDKAVFVLVNQIIEATVGIAVIRAAAKSSKIDPWPADFLRIDFRNPFRKPDGWLAWGLFGVVLSPAVVLLAATLIEAIGIKDDPTARGTADIVAQLLVLDPLTFGCLFGTTAVLAPLLEETVFRGFLLPSLAKVMPTPLAVVLSSVAFGLVHLSPRDTPQLTALGMLLGFSYVRSKNLLTPMLIHGAWNGTVLCVLYYLVQNGVDVQKMLHSGGV